jgi:sec-independent protein translocase protein TatB
MFDIGWIEMLVIAIVLIVVVGPKDLPRMLRTFGQTTTKLRTMAGDFRKQFDEALKEAELDEVKNLVNDARKLNPTADIKKALNPMQKAADDVRAGLEAAMKPQKKPEPAAAPAAVTAEPVKAGPAAVPDGTAKTEPAPPLTNGHDAVAAPARASTPGATKAPKPATKQVKPAKPALAAKTASAAKTSTAKKTGGKA